MLHTNENTHVRLCIILYNATQSDRICNECTMGVADPTPF
jgi:hypothetical protein